MGKIRSTGTYRKDLHRVLTAGGWGPESMPSLRVQAEGSTKREKEAGERGFGSPKFSITYTSYFHKDAHMLADPLKRVES